MSKRAKVHWLTAEEGGRTELPSGARYTTLARFPEREPGWPEGGWTVVLDFDRAPSEQGNPSIGSVGFLMADAPSDWLRDGEQFELYEGLKRVASVEVLRD